MDFNYFVNVERPVECHVDRNDRFRCDDITKIRVGPGVLSER